MALKADELSEKLTKVLKMKDKDGIPLDPTKMSDAMAQGLVQVLKAAKTMNPLVMGTGIALDAPAPNAGQLVSGVAFNGKIIGLIPAPLISKLIAAATAGVDPKFVGIMQANITSRCTAMCNYIMASALVNFNKVEGGCTALLPKPPFPGAPGALIAGQAMNGKIQGLVGPSMASMVASAMGYLPMPPDFIPFHTEICDYIMQNAEVTYMTGTIIGSFAIGGGPLIAGMGQNGLIK
jgi:hypothetical protein